MKVSTVAVNRGGVKVIINASDYTGEDKPWKEPRRKSAPKTRKKEPKQQAE